MSLHYARRTVRKVVLLGFVLTMLAGLVTVTFLPRNAGAQDDGPIVLYVNAAVSTSGNGYSWDQAFAGLQEALSRSDSIDEPVQIWVARGTYRPHETDRTASFSLRNNVEIYGGFSGTEATPDQRDWRANRTTLSGNLGTRATNTDNSYTVVTGTGIDATAVLDGFTVTGANADGSALQASSNLVGGGFYLHESSPVLRNLTVSGNEAHHGSGVYITAFSYPTLENLTISGNLSRSVGGGIYYYDSGGVLANSLISGNHAGNLGGALYVLGNPEIVNTTISGNTAGTGGGIYVVESELGIANSIIWGNAAPINPELHIDELVTLEFTHGIIGGGCPDGASECRHADPLFVDPRPASEAPTSDGDYRLTTGSPAIDAGTNDAIPVGITHDLNGNPRIVNDVVDLGPYEWMPDPPDAPPFEPPDDPDAPMPDPPGGPPNGLPGEQPDFAPLDEIANPHFWRTWARTDLPVRNGNVSRTWMWGPGPFTDSRWETYAESPGGEREMAFFDKTRMEINHPGADSTSIWYVTNGLLVVEMISGNRQFGDDTFVFYGPANVHVAGDPDDPDSPTYASFTNLLDAPASPVGTLLTQRVDRSGAVAPDDRFATYQVSVAHVDDVTDHGIAGPFWTFMNSHGLVYEDGSLTSDRLFPNPYYATGRPVAEAYWATVQVSGVPRDVLMQCFERRCLTYTPGNPDGFVVEAGNVGQHYFSWRYVLAPD